jgi:hypothetical protein
LLLKQIIGEVRQLLVAAQGCRLPVAGFDGGAVSINELMYAALRHGEIIRAARLLLWGRPSGDQRRLEVVELAFSVCREFELASFSGPRRLTIMLCPL